MKRAVYAGSFDPLTNGHLWMIRQGAAIFDELIVAIGDNPDKSYTFSPAERFAMVQECVSDLQNVRVESFHNQFLIDFALSRGIHHIVRGIRNLADYEFERGMRHINHDISSSVTMVFLMPPREISEISSSFVKGLIGPANWETVAGRYIPAPVLHRLHAYAVEKKERL